MYVLDAARNTVDNFPGGAESLAPRIGMSAAILRNKVNPNCSTNHLTLLEAQKLMKVADDPQILQAMAADMECGVEPLALEHTQGSSVLSLVLKLDTAEGELARVIHDALVDETISPREMKAISNASLEDQRALLALVARLAAQVKKAPGAE